MKQAKPTSQNRNLIVILSVLATLLLSAVVSYFAYDTYMDRQDKQRFETVRSSVKVLHSRLQKAAAPGVEWQMRTFCSQGSVKFQEPSKSCQIITDTEVLVTSGAEATKLIERYRTLFKQASDIFKAEDPYTAHPLEFPQNLANGYAGAGYREKETNMVCSSFFTIDDRFRENKAKRILEISFSCNAGARELHYPEQTLEQIIENS